jgi:hypothetical protein
VNFSSFESGQYQYLVLVQAHPVQQISYPSVGVGWPDLEWKAGTAQDTGTGRSDVAGEISLIDLLTTHGSGTGSGAVLKDSVYLCARTVFMSSVAINPVPPLSIGRMRARGRHGSVAPGTGPSSHGSLRLRKAHTKERCPDMMVRIISGLLSWCCFLSERGSYHLNKTRTYEYGSHQIGVRQILIPEYEAGALHGKF